MYDNLLLSILSASQSDNNDSCVNIDPVQIKDALNTLFPENLCVNVILTKNTDNIFFGVMINPTMTAQDTISILISDNKCKLQRYQLELDSKLFDIGMTVDEITAYIIYEVSNMMDDENAIEKVRHIIDMHLMTEDDVINLRDSVNFSQLISFAIKDTLYKVNSIVFVEDSDDLRANKSLKQFDLVESAISAREKIINSAFGSGASLHEPKISILKWVFAIYNDMKHNSAIARDTLNDAKIATGSQLQKTEINKTLSAIDNIKSEILSEANEEIVNEAKKGSFFASLKQNGLRSIEDDLYEYKIRIKNCDTEEDAMYILRGINTRLSILEDYLFKTQNLSPDEIAHWKEVAMAYRMLRDELAKKKIVNKKQYGVFFDYDQLDKLDNTDEE